MSAFEHQTSALERTAPPEMREFVALLFLRARYEKHGADLGQWLALERQFVNTGSPHAALVCRAMMLKERAK